MTKDLISPELFGNEAGEDEPEEILNSYFIDKDGFAPFYSAKNKLQIVRSRKGVGKSALLKKTQSSLEGNSDVITLYIRVFSLSSG